jgi:hypothetical protein
MHTPDTPESEISIDYQLTIKDEISTFQRRVLKYRQALNDEAVWLFLATLGCWSVTYSALQFVALQLTWIIFLKRMINRSKDTKSFAKWVQIIEDRIEQTSLPEDSKKARLYDLEALKKNEMSMLTSLKRAWVFLLCCIFYILTLSFFTYTVVRPYVYAALHIVPKSAY